MRRISFLIFLIAGITLSACLANEIKFPKFNEHHKEVAKEYRNMLKAESITTTTSVKIRDDEKIASLDITVIDAMALEEDKDDMEKQMKQLASDYYRDLENKEDFNKVKVIVETKTSAVLTITEKTIFIFTSEELMEESSNDAEPGNEGSDTLDI